MFKSLLIAASMLAIVSCGSKKETAKSNESATTTAEVTQTGKVQTTCPVMEGNPIDKNLYVDVNGKRIYICCGGCVAPIKNDPDKYIAKMEAEGIVLEDVPK